MSVTSHSANEMGPIPTVIRIGVLGHRYVDEPDLALRMARPLFSQLYAEFAGLSAGGGYRVVLLSSLAEGADQILARAALSAHDAHDTRLIQLRAILPFPEDEVVPLFNSKAGVAGFHELLKICANVKVLSRMPNDDAAYAECGRTLVDNSDLVVAIWNGQPSTGSAGTYPVLMYARELGKRTIVLNTSNSYAIQCTASKGSFDYRLRFAQVRAFNNSAFPKSGLGQQCREMIDRMHQIDPGSSPVEQPFGELFIADLKLMIHADLVAGQAARASRRIAAATQWLSFGAILAVATQISVFPQDHMLIIFEIVSIVAILVLATIANYRAWQTRWADYRYLAERMRATLFRLYHQSTERHGPTQVDEVESTSSDDWVSLLTEWIKLDRRGRPEFVPFLGNATVRILWIEAQVAYYDDRSQALLTADHRLRVAGFLSFALTGLAAICHLVAKDPILAGAMSVIALIGPAFGAAIVAIRAHREMQKHATRYRSSSTQLKRLSRLITATTDSSALRKMLATVDGILRLEHTEWRTTASTRELGPS